MSVTGMLWAPERTLGGRMGRSVCAQEATAILFQRLQTESPMTAAHSERVARHAVALGLALDLPLARVRHLERCGLLHDVGKLGIAAAILEKPGALTEEEWRVIRTHPTLGLRIVRAYPALHGILPAVAYHHERYDGKGYPYGICGADLPLEARIISICDAFDSMTEDRPYRQGMPVAEAVRRLEEGAGSQFDPALVTAFSATR